MLSRASLVKCLFHVGEVVAIIPLSVFLSESVGVLLNNLSALFQLVGNIMLRSSSLRVPPYFNRC